MNTTQSYNHSSLEEPLVASHTHQNKNKKQPKKQNPKKGKKEKVFNNEDQASVKWRDFARFATGWDIFLMTLGTIVSFANGWALPLLSLIFGSMTSDIATYWDDLTYVARKYALLFLALGGVTWVCSYISLASWMVAGEKQAIRFRIAYFKALLRQEISWYDKNNSSEISTKVANDCFAIQAAIGEKVSTCAYTLGNLVGGITIAIFNGWKLALVLAVVIVIPLIVAGAVCIFSIQKFMNASTKAYETAGGYAEQAITEIRTVRSLSGEDLELFNYVKYLGLVKGITLKYGTIAGFSMGFIFSVLYTSFALGLWYGAKLVEDPTTGYDAGKVVTIFFSLINGMFSFGQITPCIKAFSSGKQALGRVYALLVRKPTIDIEDETGLTPESVTGEITFDRVAFAYPIRPKEGVLNDFNAVFRANKKTAIVGESGSGKSTCMQLIERFYDVEEGSIKLDGHNIKDLNLRWFRNKIGYVGQEPVLFATTIKNNLLFGKENATMEELIEATKKARAYEFISKLENGFDTYVGSGGAQLSGGQKQRLAIARVILKDPKILLLDEATSALDRKNEREIQETLDYICEGKTTIIIAHRISTIQNADKIIFVDKGRVVEEGTHNELIERNEKYRKIAKHQLAKKNDGIEDEEEEEKVNEDEKLSKKKNYYDNLEEELGLTRNQETSEVIDLEIPMPKRKTPPKAGKKVREIQSWTKEEDSKTRKAQEKAMKKKKTDPKESIFQIFWKLFRYDHSHKWAFALMLLFATTTGAIIPTFAVLFAQMIDILNKPDAPDFHSRTNFIAIMFMVISVSMLFSFGLQATFGNIIGERITKVLRVDLYKKILHMDMAWFDKPENTPGTLMTRLAADTTLVNSLVSTVVAIAMQSISSLLVGLIVAFITSWQVTLICLAATPLSLISGYFQQEFQSGYSANTDTAYKDCGGFLTEMIVNMRTVASFGREKSLNQTYASLLQKPLKLSRRRGNKAGFIFGLSQFLLFGIVSVSFYFSIHFLSKGDISFLDMYTTFFALVFSAYGSGAATQFMNDLGAAKNAAKAIFATFDEETKIEGVQGRQETSQDQLKGLIEFKNVTFKYPSREQLVIENLDLKIEPRQKVAFVGPSGCGKSTIFQLLLRFYDVQSGEILIDGRDIKEYDIRYLRQQFGLVLQEPVLFRGTIEENIRYNNADVSINEIRKAAQNANALNFIESNQFECIDTDNNGDYGSGFQRKVGPKGSQLSGGQKQRIAIARAIIRNPAIYLFDEPTSALDSQNEESIQESLERLMEKSTSITIAHRMSTVKNCEKIFVFLEGKIVESGDYKSLVEKQGVFYKLEKGLPLDEK